MDFLERQDLARRQTRLLVGLFLLATAAIVVAVDAVVWLAVFSGAGFAAHQGWTTALWQPLMCKTLAWSSAVTIGLILSGSLYKRWQLSEGGAALARSLGADAVPPNAKEPPLRRLRNTVEEMAIASGLPLPEVFVLNQEPGINAFAAGFGPDDAAIAVTRGALERLDRDELQGVVAHEFGHILNHDMRLNTALLGWLHGIFLVKLAGRIAMPRRRSSTFGRHGRTSFPLTVLGIGLLAVGSIGAFFGRLIQAAVSRQRERLADASAVQLTRNPDSLASALFKIGSEFANAPLTLPQHDELAHLLFASPGGWWATHPSIEERIHAIRPGFEASHVSQADGSEEPAREKLARTTRPAAESVPLSPTGLLAAVGAPTIDHLAAAQDLIDSFSEELTEACHSPTQCAGVVLATLLSHDSNTFTKQLVQVRRSLGRAGLEGVEKRLPEIRGLGRNARLPLIQICASTLRQALPDEQLSVRDLVKRMTEVDAEVDVFEYAAVQLLERAATPARPDDPEASLVSLQSPALTVLSALAEMGHGDPFECRAAYAQAMGALGLDSQREPLARHAWTRALGPALNQLGALRPTEKARLLEAAAETVIHDGRVTLHEGELLRALAAALGCPVPDLSCR